MTLAGAERSLQFAQIHRDRGQIRQAHWHERAAQSLTIAAQAIETWGSDFQLERLVERNGRPDRVVDAQAAQFEALSARNRAPSAA
jgi:hypothetical protein